MLMRNVITLQSVKLMDCYIFQCKRQHYLTFSNLVSNIKEVTILLIIFGKGAQNRTYIVNSRKINESII